MTAAPSQNDWNAVSTEALPPPLRIGSAVLNNRLIMGSGRYDSLELMRDALLASDCHAVTIAIRRDRLHDAGGRNVLDFLDPARWLLLPNTAGCFDAETAVRVARMGREILAGLGQSHQRWVKLEVLSDSSRLLPDPIETLKATERLVAEGFEVLCYCSDDPALARRLQAAGAVSVMPGGSPIGSGLGLLNPNNLRAIVDDLKARDADYPILVDAGIGSASDAALAMELGVDGVMINTSVARAGHPIGMARAMRWAVAAGWLARHSGRIAKVPFATASSPEIGVIASRQPQHPR